MQTILKITEQLNLTRDELLKIIREKLSAAREVRYLSNIEPAAAGEKSLAIVYDGKLETDVKEILKQFIKKDETVKETTTAMPIKDELNPVPIVEVSQKPIIVPKVAAQPAQPAQSTINLDESTQLAVPDLGAAPA